MYVSRFRYGMRGFAGAAGNHVSSEYGSTPLTGFSRYGGMHAPRAAPPATPLEKEWSCSKNVGRLEAGWASFLETVILSAGCRNNAAHRPAGRRPMKYTISGRDEKTLMKLIVHAESDKVLGCHM